MNTSKSVPQDFSPSAIREWLSCPMRWWLGQRWTPTSDDPARRVIGGCVAEGLASFYRAIHGGADAAEALPQALLDTDTKLDQTWAETPEYTLDGARVIAQKAVKLGSRTDLLRGGAVVAVERDLGGSRPDLVIRWPEPLGLAIIDHKWSESQKGEYISSRLDRQDTDVQLYLYGARWEDMFGEPVKWVGHHIITLNPRQQTWFEPIALDPAHLALFRADIAQAQEVMAAHAFPGAPAPFGRWTACQSREESFGRCPFFDACHVCFRDPARMAGLYTRREPHRRRDA